MWSCCFPSNAWLTRCPGEGVCVVRWRGTWSEEFPVAGRHMSLWGLHRQKGCSEERRAMQRYRQEASKDKLLPCWKCEQSWPWFGEGRCVLSQGFFDQTEREIKVGENLISTVSYGNCWCVSSRSDFPGKQILWQKLVFMSRSLVARNTFSCFPSTALFSPCLWHTGCLGYEWPQVVNEMTSAYLNGRFQTSLGVWLTSGETHTHTKTWSDSLYKEAGGWLCAPTWKPRVHAQ